MLKVLIVDDKPHAGDQVAHALERLCCGAYAIRWVDTVVAFPEAAQSPFDLAFIDFFLTKDSLYGTDILDRVSARTLVGFSSNRFGSEAIKAEADRLRFERTAAVQKIKESLHNPELYTFLQNFLKNERP